MGRVRSPKRRVRHDDFIVGLCSDYARISSNRLSIGGSTSGSFRWNLELQDFVAGAVFGEVGGWLYLLHALEMTFHMWRRSLMTFILRGRRSIWWGWRVTLLAPRIGNDVSYVTQIIDDIHFVWQEVGGWLFVTGAALGDVLRDSRDAKCCILQYKIVSKMGRVRSPKRRVRDDDFIVGLCSDYARISSNRLSIGGSTSGSFRWNLELQDFVAGAVFDEVGGWLYLLHALEMTFHMWRRSLMTFILCGRRSIWWGSRLILLAARIANDDSYVTQIIDDIHFVWQAQYLVKLKGDSCCAAHCKWRFKVVPE